MLNSVHVLEARAFQTMATVTLLLTLAGCANSSKAPVQVESRSHATSVASATSSPTTSGHYLVARGDTLYSIAFRYGWDWKALAAHNNISAPYVIRPGQRINFAGQNASPSVASHAVPVTTAAVSVPSVAQTTAPAKTTVVRQPATPAAAATTTVPAATATAAVSKQGWMWPTQGTVIGRFSSNGSLNKGVDIAGNLGQPVLSASDGAVVYAGSGLRGYGELIIIKHGDTYVSAYGHNRRLLVREGQQVKAGQQIAEMGSTGTDRVKLHFEIRRQGKPVDPLQYLPNR